MRRSADELFMKQALELAHQGIGLASPNPCVGALVVDELGRIVGRGVHKYAERKHAEVVAIEEAGLLARGNTLYLNLEPCCHQGRTGPCTEAVIAAGVGRVVAAMRDPNPLVAGKGLAQLRAAGIEVAEGVLENEARKLNEAFARYIRTGLPFVTLKAAMTLDGKIAAPPRRVEAASVEGPSTTYITGAAALKQVHRLRHAVDAIMAGIGTVLADNPLLNDRSGLARRLPLLRVILDSNLRIPLDSRIVSSAASSAAPPQVSPTAGRDLGHPGISIASSPGDSTTGDVLVFCCRASAEKKRELEAHGVRVEVVPPADSVPDLQCVLRVLGEMKITSMLVEGGATVNRSFLHAGLVDKVWLFYAPRILGGDSSIPLLSGDGFGSMADALRLHDTSLHRYGEDFAAEGYLSDPYA